MKPLVLNIGLQVGDTTPTGVEAASRARIAMHAIHGFFGGGKGGIGEHRVDLSDGREPTLVVELFPTRVTAVDLNWFIWELALALGQDCIAVAEVDEGEDTAGVSHRFAVGGQLIGPRAHAWGAFNSNFFLTE